MSAGLVIGGWASCSGFGEGEKRHTGIGRRKLGENGGQVDGNTRAGVDGLSGSVWSREGVGPLRSCPPSVHPVGSPRI